MQIHNCDKKPNGRRYNSDQKNFSLALYKQGAKSYRFMHRSFVLPVKSTLTTHSAHLVIQPGIDPTLMKFITNKVKDFALTDKYCMVTWDEVALRPHLDYSPSRDIIDGFVDIEIRHPLFATHALTFMVRGINVRYKQPVAHFYTCNITGVELALLIRRVTEAVLDTGNFTVIIYIFPNAHFTFVCSNMSFGDAVHYYLKYLCTNDTFFLGLLVIGSLSDQVNINVSAVNILVNPNNPKTKPNGEIIKYRIRDVVIVHCWDPPHLIKVVRNNLLVKDLTHYVDKRWTISDTKIDTCVKKIPVQCASWSHIEELYQSDILSTHRMLENLSDEHIKPVKKKMKVSVATQVLSQTVGEAILLCISNDQLPANYCDTANILLFFNDLYDSVNGGGEPEVDSLKGSIEENSIHFAYWEYALSKLKDMNFVNRSDGKINNNSSVLRKFESTIRGYIEITRICLNANMPQVSLRYTILTDFA